MGLLGKYSRQGFTLVELVIVIIVLAILSSVAIPKFVNRSGFEDYTVRDQLIARLRLVQLQSMNADPSDGVSDNACYWVVVKSDCFYNEHTTKNGANCQPPSASNVCDDNSYNEYGTVSFPVGMLIEDRSYNFDIEGRLLSGNAPILLNGDNGLSIVIEDEGFIHEG